MKDKNYMNNYNKYLPYNYYENNVGGFPYLRYENYGQWQFPYLSMNQPINIFSNKTRGHHRDANMDSMALESYIYGYPLVLMNVTKQNMLSSGSRINTFSHQLTPITPDFNTLVSPNADTLYSFAWLDLKKEPVVLHVPNTDGIFYSMDMLDPWTNVFKNIGTRATGSNEKNFVIAGPNWLGYAFEDVVQINAPTNNVLIIGRAQIKGKTTHEKLNEIQQKFTVSPLSMYDKPSENINRKFTGNRQETPRMSPAEIVNKMDAETFYKIMTSEMYMNRPEITDPDINKNLSTLGILPNLNFEYHNLSPDIKQALEYSISNGHRVIGELIDDMYRNNNVNGWAVIRKDIGNYGKNYNQRAAIAKILLGASLPQDILFALAFYDNDNQELNGSNNYIIHFTKDMMPPTNAFWSISLYNQNGYFAQNPINRYVIVSNSGKLTHNSDGSLDLYVQNMDPGTDKESNWLPSPEEKFYLVLRIFSPKAQAMDEKWIPPEIMDNQQSI